MCPSKRSAPAPPPSPLVDNSHNKHTGLSILSIHTESVVGTLGVIGLIVALALIMICIYRKYIWGGEQAIAALAPATIPYASPSMEYRPVRGSALALMEGLEMRPVSGARMIRNLSQDQLDEISRVVQASRHWVEMAWGRLWFWTGAQLHEIR